MCRLYALRANEPTRVECSLVRSQNNLMRQSERDSEGLVHGHGWGVAEGPSPLELLLGLGEAMAVGGDRNNFV